MQCGGSGDSYLTIKTKPPTYPTTTPASENFLRSARVFFLTLPSGTGNPVEGASPGMGYEVDDSRARQRASYNLITYKNSSPLIINLGRLYWDAPPPPPRPASLSQARVCRLALSSS
jgi:hypothetical protein